jgi:hypothetical protein
MCLPGPPAGALRTARILHGASIFTCLAAAPSPGASATGWGTTRAGWGAACVGREDEEEDAPFGGGAIAKEEGRARQTRVMASPSCCAAAGQSRVDVSHVAALTSRPCAHHRLPSAPQPARVRIAVAHSRQLPSRRRAAGSLRASGAWNPRAPHIPCASPPPSHSVWRSPRRGGGWRRPHTQRMVLPPTDETSWPPATHRPRRAGSVETLRALHAHRGTSGGGKERALLELWVNTHATTLYRNTPLHQASTAEQCVERP